MRVATLDRNCRDQCADIPLRVTGSAFGNHDAMGYQQYIANRWAADRLPRTKRMLLALFGALIAVLLAIFLSNLVLRVLVTAFWIVYAVACAAQGVRTTRR